MTAHVVSSHAVPVQEVAAVRRRAVRGILVVGVRQVLTALLTAQAPGRPDARLPETLEAAL